MIELTTEEPQRNRVNKWTLYWYHATDPDACYPADPETLAKAGFVPAAKLEAAEQRVRRYESALHLIAGTRGTETASPRACAAEALEQAEGAKGAEGSHGGAGGGDEEGYDMVTGTPKHRDVRNWANAVGLHVLGRTPLSSLLRYIDQQEKNEAQLRDLTAERESLLKIVGLALTATYAASAHLPGSATRERLEKIERHLRDALRSKPSDDSKGKEPALWTHGSIVGWNGERWRVVSNLPGGIVVVEAGGIRAKVSARDLTEPPEAEDGDMVPEATGEAKPPDTDYCGACNKLECICGAASKSGCSYPLCQNSALSGGRCYDHQPQRCPEPAPKAAFAVGRCNCSWPQPPVGANHQDGCPALFMTEPADPAPPPESPDPRLLGPVEALRREIVEALHYTSKHANNASPKEFLECIADELIKAGRP
jgi:hypothetical protein